MRPKFFTIMFFTFLILCCSVVVRAELQNQWYGGQRVVYDATNDVYFYPLLSNMLQMTKAQQQEFIDQLNAEAYATVTDWQFANLEQMKALGLSICENATQIMGDDTWDGPKQFTPIHLEQFFEFTQYFPAPAPGAPPFPPEHYLTMGRTADEVGALIEVPNDVNYIGELVYSDPNSTTSTYRTIEGQPSQGQYHFPQLFNPATGELDTLMFDGDLNYVADDATTSPMMGMNQECSAWVVSTKGPAEAAPLENQFYDSDRVVYDPANDLYWYPFLTDTVNMTRAEQEEFIVGLNAEGYANIKSWQMATYDQVQVLKDSLAGMGTTRIEYEWPWTPPGSPRQIGSPFLAWPVQVDQFFTPTAEANLPPQVFEGVPAQTYNGRTAGWGWRNDGTPGQPDDVDWRYGEADDHFGVLGYMTPGEFATMVFNYDQHYLPDDATVSLAVGGPVGAWIVSEKRPPLENQFYDGDRVVYDPTTNLYWYPSLTDTVNMTRAEQEEFIVGLNAKGYANINTWEMATWKQTTALKWSLAKMATECILPTGFGPDFGTPVLVDRGVTSPYMAWEVDSLEYFTPTAFTPDELLPPMVQPSGGTYMFNGRTADDAWGWRNDGEPGQPDDVEWRLGDAADHWVAHSYKTGMDGDGLTMMFNIDQHYLPDDGTDHGMLGPVGTWIVSEKELNKN